MVLPKSLRSGDVCGLPLFRPAADQMYLISDLSEVHSVARSEINFQFRDSAANAPRVPKVSTFDPINAVANNTAGSRIESA
jgi:hypothetical protein